MKKRKSLLAVLIAIPALLLSSCDLLPGLNTPSRRKSSKEEEEISEPSRSSSSKSTEKTSSYHSHTFGSWTTTKQATCVEEGEQVRVCSICGIEQFRTIARTDHQWGDWQMQVAPSCVEEGRRIKECVVCGVTSTENVPALGHDYDYENASWQQEPTAVIS